jgi:transcriptional regulator with XRE-family HTH domain
VSKPVKRAQARFLRQEFGMPMKQIAAELGVSVSSVSLWTRDIEITKAQRTSNLTRAGKVRGDAWRERYRAMRRGFQQEGRATARQGNPLHLAGCMLYWAEGSKGRNAVALTNSDLELVRLFHRFLVKSMAVRPDEMTIRLNVYLGNGKSIREIESHWLSTLELPRTCLRGHSLNSFPTSSSGRKKNALPFGVCTLRVARSTRLVQHIYGAIQEYGGFEEPRWLDGLY